MLYSLFINKAKDMVITQLDNGTWYLEPEWQDILYRNGLGDIENLEDSYINDPYGIEDILMLEVTKRNAAADKKSAVIDWLYEVITAQVEPTIMKEESEYLKNLSEYLSVMHPEPMINAKENK